MGWMEGKSPLSPCPQYAGTVTTEKVFEDFLGDPSDHDAYFRDISTVGGCTSEHDGGEEVEA